MTQRERDKVRTQKEKRSKASLYRLSDPHKFDDTEGEYWAQQEPFEVENHRPKNVGRRK